MRTKTNTYSIQARLGLIFLIVAGMTGIVSECNGQDKSVLKGDTLYYAGQKFYTGQLVRLWYGSGSDKDFAFAYIGSGLGGFQKAGSGYAKSTLIIEQVLIDRRTGLSSVKGKVVGVGMGLKMIVSIEGAVDNKEIELQ